MATWQGHFVYDGATSRTAYATGQNSGAGQSQLYSISLETLASTSSFLLAEGGPADYLLGGVINGLVEGAFPGQARQGGDHVHQSGQREWSVPSRRSRQLGDMAKQGHVYNLATGATYAIGEDATGGPYALCSSSSTINGGAAHRSSHFPANQAHPDYFVVGVTRSDHQVIAAYWTGSNEAVRTCRSNNGATPCSAASSATCTPGNVRSCMAVPSEASTPSAKIEPGSRTTIRSHSADSRRARWTRVGRFFHRQSPAHKNPQGGARPSNAAPRRHTLHTLSEFGGCHSAGDGAAPAATPPISGGTGCPLSAA